MASFISRGASVHLYLSGLPIDLWVVVLEPDIAEDYALLSKVRDSEKHLFRVGLVVKDYIYHFRDLPCFVGGAIYIVHWYRARDALGANTLHMDKVFVYEAAHSFGVQECLNEMHLAGVSVLISIGRVIDVPWASRVLAESCLGSLFSHFGL